MKIRSWTDENLIDVVKNSHTISDVLKKLNLALAGGSYHHIQCHMKRLKIELKTSRVERQLSGIKSHQFSKKYTDREIFKINSEVSQAKLKSRYLELRSDYKCDICELVDWQTKRLSLHLDHMNGNRYDNRKSNLRLLCPNCHSLTETYAGKNKRISIGL